MKNKQDKKTERDPYTGSGEVCYYEGGYGNRRHECPACNGTGRVYEGGYGNRCCSLCGEP